MKKKTALTIAALATLAAGIAVGSKVKKYNEEKNEKEAIKVELESILIPNAEKELDSLLKRDKELQDSVAWYEEALKELYYEAGKKDNATGVNDSVLNKQTDKLIDLLIKINTEIDDAFWKTKNKYYEDLTKKDYEDLWYLSEGILGKSLIGSRIRVPGGFIETTARTPDWQHDPNGSLYHSYTGVEYFVDNKKDKNKDFLFSKAVGVTQDLIYSLEATVRKDAHEVEAYPYVEEIASIISKRLYEPITSYEDKLEIFKVLDTVLKSIDNSKNIIDQKTLDEAIAIVNEAKKYLMPHVKIEETSKKADSFKSGRQEVQKQVDAKKQVLANYKNPNTVNNMYNSRKTQKR